MPKDTFIIEVTDTGVIKMDTDGISAVNHANGESFIRQLCRMAGGFIKRTAKAGHAPHTHTHNGVEHTH